MKSDESVKYSCPDSAAMSRRCRNAARRWSAVDAGAALLNQDEQLVRDAYDLYLVSEWLVNIADKFIGEC